MQARVRVHAQLSPGCAGPYPVWPDAGIRHFLELGILVDFSKARLCLADRDVYLEPCMWTSNQIVDVLLAYYNGTTVKQTAWLRHVK